jgi:xanthine dehydrogenase accessory factor
VVVASMGRYDDEAALAALRAGAGFVAVVASRRRHEEITVAVRAAGMPDEALARLKAPAGLDIGASAPEEIAVSIIAEIIARRERLPPPGLGRAEPTANPTTAIDPVCGMEVVIAGARHWLDHDGVRFYFCCPSCRRQFERDPGRFLAARGGGG